MNTPPIDEWYWDDALECVMAQDMADKRGGDPVEVDFSEPHIGRLAAAAPALLRALVAVRSPQAGALSTTWCWCISRTLQDAPHEEECEQARAAVLKAGLVLP